MPQQTTLYCREFYNKGGIDQNFIRRYTRKWWVRTYDPSADHFSATNTNQLPAIGDPYVNPLAATADPGCTCRSVEAERDDSSPLLWVVTAEYSSERNPIRWPEDPRTHAGAGSVPGGGVDRGSTNESKPTERAPKVVWGKEKHQEEYTIDTDKVPVMNSSNQRHIPAPQRDRGRRTLTFTRWEDTFPHDLADEFEDMINDAPIILCGRYADEGCAKCDFITGQSVYENKVFCYEVTYQISFRKLRFGTSTGTIIRGWDDAVLDAGTMAFQPTGVGSAESLSAILDRNGVPVTEPVPLDGQGHTLLQTASPYVPVSGPPPIYRIYRPYESKDFTLLGIPEF